MLGIKNGFLVESKAVVLLTGDVEIGNLMVVVTLGKLMVEIAIVFSIAFESSIFPGVFPATASINRGKSTAKSSSS